MARRVWTDEQRKAQSERCKRHQPWKHSTGPKSVKGKRKVSQNSRKPASMEMEEALISAAYDRLYNHDDHAGYLELCHQAKLIRRRFWRHRRNKIEPWKPEGD